MNLLIIADDESVLHQLPAVRADLLISCGDLPDEIILKAAEKCSCRQIFAVKGNHDSGAPFRDPIQDLHLNTISFEGITFGGFCGSWKYKPRGHYLFEQSEVETLLSPFPRVDVFITHNSPHQVHDREDDVHTGFVAFNSYIMRSHPRFHLHGHQHINKESQIGQTRVIGTFGYRQLVIPT